MAKKKQSRKHVMKLEEGSKEITCKVPGFEAKIIKITRLLETNEGRDALDTHCGDNAAKLRDLCAKLGVETAIAFAVEFIMKELK